MGCPIFIIYVLHINTSGYIERLNVKVVQDTYQNPFLLSEQEEEDTIAKHRANYSRLTVPRRPPWDKSMSAEQLHQRERESFLDWRRGMAQ